MHRFSRMADRPMRLRPLRALATSSGSYHGSRWAATSHECWRSTRRCRPMLVRLFQGRALPPIATFQPWYYPYANTNRRRGPTNGASGAHHGRGLVAEWRRSAKGIWGFRIADLADGKLKHLAGFLLDAQNS